MPDNTQVAAIEAEFLGTMPTGAGRLLVGFNASEGELVAAVRVDQALDMALSLIKTEADCRRAADPADAEVSAILATRVRVGQGADGSTVISLLTEGGAELAFSLTAPLAGDVVMGISRVAAQPRPLRQ